MSTVEMTQRIAEAPPRHMRPLDMTWQDRSKDLISKERRT